jgi:hypothetical protein
MRSILRPPTRSLLAAAALLSALAFSTAVVSGQVPNGPEPASAPTLALNPDAIAITLTHEFEFSRSPTSFDRAVKNIQDQMDTRRDAELDKASTLGAIWRARFWNYLPKATGGTMNSPTEEDDDPFFTPSYLTLASRVLDRQLAESDARARVFFKR